MWRTLLWGIPHVFCDRCGREVPGLEGSFYAWVSQHGYVWFEGDLALAAAIATHLGIDLEIDGVAVADEVPGVTQG